MSKDDYAHLPYRLNAGAVLFNKAGLVLVARRADLHPSGNPAQSGWQLPQGGIDKHEDPRVAVLRELKEEIGTDNAEIIAEYPDWLDYELPPHLLGNIWKARYRGQRQKWFALKFLGADAEIRLDADPHPEFDAWRWTTIAELPALAVSFKKSIYETLARDFAHLAHAATADEG